MTAADHPSFNWRRGLGSLGGLGQHERQQLTTVGLLIGLWLVVGLVALYAFTRLGDAVLDQQTTALDASAAADLRQLTSPAMNGLATGVSLLGSEAIFVFGGILLIVLGRQRRWRAAVALVLVTLGAQVLNDVLKVLFQRTRPESVTSLIAAQQYSFPSGHAMVSAAFYSFVGFIAWRALSGGRRWLVVAALTILVLLIGVARIYLEAHYLSDVLAGYCAGLAWTDTVIVTSQFLKPRRTLYKWDQHRSF